MREILKALLLQEEGVAIKAYEDSRGVLTIGVGHNLELNPLPEEFADMIVDGTPLTEDQVFELLDLDMDKCISRAESFAWFHLLDEVRQAVVAAMIFQMGLSGFKKFKKMIEALNQGDYSLAAVEMLDSKWSLQTPERAKRMAKRMRNGD